MLPSSPRQHRRLPRQRCGANLSRHEGFIGHVRFLRSRGTINGFLMMPLAYLMWTKGITKLGKSTRRLSKPAMLVRARDTDLDQCPAETTRLTEYVFSCTTDHNPRTCINRSIVTLQANDRSKSGNYFPTYDLWRVVTNLCFCVMSLIACYTSYARQDRVTARSQGSYISSQFFSQT